MGDKRVAVVTDSTTNQFYFPMWYRYYADQFGSENLYVVTSLEGRRQFSDFDLGGVWRVTHLYDDRSRAQTLTSAVAFLLTSYDYVIRVDVDEFLIPDLRRYNSLREFVSQTTLPYVTARGVNVMEGPDELPIDRTEPILVRQRRLARLETTMYKTSLTSVPLRWTGGGHYCSAYPMLDDLYLIHLKRSDVDMLVQFGKWMLTQLGADPALEKYYGQPREQYVAYNAVIGQNSKIEGWEGLKDLRFDDQYFKDIVFEPESGFYRGKFHYNNRTVVLPSEFDGVI